MGIKNGTLNTIPEMKTGRIQKTVLLLLYYRYGLCKFRGHEGVWFKETLHNLRQRFVYRRRDNAIATVEFVMKASHDRYLAAWETTKNK